MKDELNKKIRELCNSAGSSAACAMAPVLTEDLGRKYDERVAAGMSELDAYRDVLRSVDRIEAMEPGKLPPTSAPPPPRRRKLPISQRDASALPSLWARVPPCSGWGRPSSISSGPLFSADGGIRG